MGENVFSEIAEAPTPGCWAKIIAQHPCKVIWASFLLGLVGIALGAAIPKAPDFGEAGLGFEPRGTDYALKLNAMRQLRAYPRHRPCGDCEEARDQGFENRRLKENLAPVLQPKAPDAELALNIAGNARHLADYRQCGISQIQNTNNSNMLNDNVLRMAIGQWTQCYSHEGHWGYNLFCREGPFQQRKVAPMVVLEDASGEGGDIGSLGKLHEICTLSKQLKSSGAYEEHGRNFGPGKCALYSLPETLMTLDTIMQIDIEAGKLVSGAEYNSPQFNDVKDILSQIISGTIPCSHLSQQMLDSTLQRVARCGTALFDGTCSRGASKETSTNFADLSCKDSTNDPNLQRECNPMVNLLVNYVYTYLVDQNYLNPQVPASARSSKLTYTNIVTPVYSEEDYYDSLMDEFSDYRGNDKPLRFAGIKLDDNGAIFNTALMLSSLYVIGSVLISFLFLVMHTKSFTFSAVVLLQVYCSMGFAYFLQRVVLPFEHFPFLNVTMAFVAIAIGVDDVFVFMDAYRQSFLILPYSSPLDSRLQWVFSRSFTAMLVTTLTTSVAFLANIVSPITTIKSFGIFSCLVVCVDFIFMMTILPSMLVVVDYTCYKNLCVCGRFNMARPDLAAEANTRGDKPKSNGLDLLYRRYLSKIVTHSIGKWILFVIGTGLGIFFLIQALGLKQSDAEELQLFTDGHPTEDYNQILFENFRFEPESKSEGLPVRIVAGVIPSDTGNYFDPFDLGPVEWGSGDLNSEEAQVWFANLCDSFSSAPLFKNLETCVYKYLRDFVARTDRCMQSGLTPCCGLSFPVARDQIPICLNEMNWYASTFDGSLLRDGSGYITAVSASYLSTQAYTSNFELLDSFYKTVKPWADRQVDSAPSSIPSPFWFSSFEFWDLQNSLNDGAYLGAGVALICCSVVLLLVVGNVVMAIYALISIVWVLSAVVASLRLFGFVLDLMVAVVMAISIGMSVDFVCHMAHAYVRHEENKSSSARCIDQLPCKSGDERNKRAADALSSMGISVTLGAMTTFFGGLVMMLTNVKFFYQFGVFLSTTMFWSLSFAIFYFPALAACIGPVGGFGDLWPVFQFFIDKCAPSGGKSKSTPAPNAEQISSVEESAPTI